MDVPEDIEERSWKEDYHLSFGSWYRNCTRCGKTFRGQREIRRECKKCARPEEMEGRIRIC